MDKRTQFENEEIAWQRLEDKVKRTHQQRYDSDAYHNRFDQVGNSSRSIKKRSYRIKEDLVIDHETNKECSFKDFSKGKIELLS